MATGTTRSTQHARESSQVIVTRVLTRMPGGTSVNGASTVYGVLSHVRCCAPIAQLFKKLPRVVSLVSSDGDLVDSGDGSDHLHRHLSLGSPCRKARLRGGYEAGGGLRQDVSHVGEFRAAIRAFAIQARIPIRFRAVRLVAALLAVKVDARVAWIVVSGTLPGTRGRQKTLLAGPRLQQRAIDREVLLRHQAPLVRLLNHLCQKLAGDISSQQPIPVLAEGRRI